MTAHYATIVVKFFDTKKIQYQVASPIPEWHNEEWLDLQSLVQQQWGGKLVARSLFHSVSLSDIETLKRVALARSEAAHLSYVPPKFENYLSLSYDATVVGHELRDAALAAATQFIVKAVSSWADVEHCYHRPEDVDPGLKRATRPVTFDAPNTDPSHKRQAHLLDAPLGIGVRSLWQFEGADGAGQRFVDIERGWKLDHKDLTDAAGRPRAQLVPGHGVISENRESIWHGTCVLGIVCAAHNDVEVIGIAPRLASMEVVSYLDDAKIVGTASALMHGAARQIERNVTRLTSLNRSRQATVRSNVVMLIEAQAELPHQQSYFPVEIYPETFEVIALATRAGIVVIEPAGNGSKAGEQQPSVDLDDLGKYFRSASPWKTPPKSLMRDAPNAHSMPGPGRLSAFSDSGAVMVACAEHPDDSPDLWMRSQESNFGSRVDCFAAGLSVVTLDATENNRVEFSGTSSASAIIAGAALCLQGVAQAHLGRTLAPMELRNALSDLGCGTGSGVGAAESVGAAGDKIGVMPDLVKIAKKWIGTR